MYLHSTSASPLLGSADGAAAGAATARAAKVAIKAIVVAWIENFMVAFLESREWLRRLRKRTGLGLYRQKTERS